jgi:TRAP-type mannitol/chloroaromatic compound transport system permease small subunit
MNAVLRTIDAVSGLSGRIAAWIIAPLIFAMVYEVAARYLFNAPTIWAFEVGYMAMGANFLLGAAYALRERAHIRIDVAYSHFPPRIKAAIDVIGYGLVFLPFSIWLSWRLALYAHGSFESGEHTGASAWSPLIWPLRAVFALGFILLSLQAVAELVRSLRMLATGVDPQAS